MKSSRIVTLCWLAVLLATGSLLLSFFNSVVHPNLQMAWASSSGAVTEVFAGGVAERAGIRAGDDLVSMAGQPIRQHAQLYDQAAGVPLDVVFSRNGRRHLVTIVPVTQERDREMALQEGGGRALWAIYSYLVYALSFWMLALGIFLLALRPNNGDARIAALTFICWAGGNFLFDQAGMGALLRPVPAPLQGAIFIIDALLVALFFAEALHFAMGFAREPERLPRRWLLLPYLAALPLFVETSMSGLGRVPQWANHFTVSDTIYVTSGSAILLAALVVLAVRIRRAVDTRARRRLQMVFVALIPGVVPFVLLVLLDRLDTPYEWRQGGRLLQWLGTMSASTIFVAAVVRQRLFGIRLLVRRSIQYALARRTLVVAMSLPSLALIAFLYRHRNDSLSEVLTGQPGRYLAIIIPLVVVLRYRRRVLDALDRRYFREQYDARQMLLDVVSTIRSGSDIVSVARLALTRIAGALHPEHISLWRSDSAGSVLQRDLIVGSAKEAPELSLDAALLALLSTDDEPLDVDSLRSAAILRRLPDDERSWIAATDAHLLVPLRRENALLGLLLLGEKLSGEPYSREDRQLLGVLAAQLAISVHEGRLRSAPPLLWQPRVEASLPMPDASLMLCPLCRKCHPPSATRCETDGSALAAEEGVPFTIEEKYEMRRLIGRGGMGSVFMARQKRLNRPVAIKILLAHLVGSATMRVRFEREAKVIARLNHSGIVTIHDFGVLPNGHAYLVMEYLDGRTLRQVIAASALQFGPMLEIILPVGEAIHMAHQSGVVHRDLKPDNIMVMQEYGKPLHPKVLDFGLARLQETVEFDDATLPQPTRSGSVIGTLPYMAPELFSGASADARSDQYSLGLIVYELLTGEHPFEAHDLASIVIAHTQKAVPSIEQKINIAPSAAAAVHRALAKNPDDRFSSTAEFVAALAASAS